MGVLETRSKEDLSAATRRHLDSPKAPKIDASVAKCERKK